MTERDREQIERDIEKYSYKGYNPCPQCKKDMGGFGPKYHDQDHMCYDCHDRLWNGEFAKKEK